MHLDSLFFYTGITHEFPHIPIHLHYKKVPEIHLTPPDLSSIFLDSAAFNQHSLCLNSRSASAPVSLDNAGPIPQPSESGQYSHTWHPAMALHCSQQTPGSSSRFLSPGLMIAPSYCAHRVSSDQATTDRWKSWHPYGQSDGQFVSQCFIKAPSRRVVSRPSISAPHPNTLLGKAAL